MRVVEADPVLARWLASAIRDRAARWRRDGLEPPAEALALADALLPQPQPSRPPAPSERARELARDRSRRWRARRRGEDVPLRRPGRPKTVTLFAR